MYGVLCCVCLHYSCCLDVSRQSFCISCVGLQSINISGFRLTSTSACCIAIASYASDGCVMLLQLFQFEQPKSELTSTMGRRSQRLKEKRIKEWAACLKTKPDVIRSGWNQYISDPTNIDFTDYYKQEENFEGMRHYSSGRMQAIDKGQWVYFSRIWDLYFNKEAVLILQMEIKMMKKKKKKKKHIFDVPVIVID